MKRILPVCLTGIILFAASCASEIVAPQFRPGGSSGVSATKPEVVAAAAFAIKAKEKVMRERKDALPAKLELVTILGAQEQVVAGMNYRLKLKVKLNGKDKEADAVVWWQAWRKPDP